MGCCLFNVRFAHQSHYAVGTKKRGREAARLRREAVGEVKRDKSKKGGFRGYTQIGSSR